MSGAVQLAQARTIGVFPTPAEWGMIKEQASLLVKSGMLPTGIKTPEAAIAIALKGRELGIPMMQAFAHIHIINGKPTISAELMLALIHRNCPGAVIDYLENTDQRCTIEARRPGGKTATFGFSMEDARKADLANKGPWKSYPGAMLRARTIAIVARALFPDAIMGCSYTPEELGAEVNEDGEVIDIGRQAAAHAEPFQPFEPPKEAPRIEPVKPVERTRMVIAREIMTVAAKIKLGGDEMGEWVRSEFGKEMKDLTIEEMEAYLETLNREMGRKAVEGS